MRSFPMNLRAYASELQRYSRGVQLTLEALHAKHRFDYIEFPDFLGEAYDTLRARRTMGSLRGAVLGIRTHMSIRLIRQINRDDWIDEERATCEHMEAWSVAHADVLLPPCEAIAVKLREQLVGCGQAQEAVPMRVVHLPIAASELRRELGAESRGRVGRCGGRGGRRPGSGERRTGKGRWFCFVGGLSGGRGRRCWLTRPRRSCGLGAILT
jgi:hypothetical protein